LRLGLLDLVDHLPVGRFQDPQQWAPSPPSTNDGGYTSTVVKRAHLTVRKTTLDRQTGAKATALSPSERVAAVWPLTLAAWQFKEPGFRESRLRRDVARVVRGGR
jgi:hypothetical protein